MNEAVARAIMNGPTRRPPTREILWWIAVVASVLGILAICALMNMPTP